MQPWDAFPFTSQIMLAEFDRISAADEADDSRLLGQSAAPKERSKGPKRTGNRVLLFSGMWEVALYRAEVLRANGLDVTTPRSKEEAIMTIKRGDVDVAVLTYTLPSETVHEMADLVRQYCPGCRLVAISESGRFDERVAPDAIVIANQGPSALVEAIRRLRRLQ